MITQCDGGRRASLKKERRKLQEPARWRERESGGKVFIVILVFCFRTEELYATAAEVSANWYKTAAPPQCSCIPSSLPRPSHIYQDCSE